MHTKKRRKAEVEQKINSDSVSLKPKTFADLPLNSEDLQQQRTTAGEDSVNQTLFPHALPFRSPYRVRCAILTGHIWSLYQHRRELKTIHWWLWPRALGATNTTNNGLVHKTHQILSAANFSKSPSRPDL